MRLLATAALPRLLAGCWVWEGCSAHERYVGNGQNWLRKGNVAPSCLSLGLPEHPTRSISLCRLAVKHWQRPSMLWLGGFWFTGDSASRLGWASLQSLGYSTITKLLCKHLVILGKVEFRCGAAWPSSPEEHQRRALNIMRLGLELAFLDYGVLMHHSYIKQQNAWRVQSILTVTILYNADRRWKNLLQSQSQMLKV